MNNFTNLKNQSTHKYLFTLTSMKTKSRLEEFRSYTLQLEQKFDTDKQSVEESYHEAINLIEHDEENDAHEYFGEMYQEIDSVNVPLFRSSTVVTMYSFLESSMNKLCRSLYKLKNYNIDLSELRGEGIVRAKSYLINFAGADFDVLNGDWSKLVALNLVRNCLVHNEGIINGSRSENKLKNTVDSTAGIYSNHYSEIIIEREYIDNCIDVIESFLLDLYNQLKDSEILDNVALVSQGD